MGCLWCILGSQCGGWAEHVVHTIIFACSSELVLEGRVGQQASTLTNLVSRPTPSSHAHLTLSSILRSKHRMLLARSHHDAGVDSLNV